MTTKNKAAPFTELLSYKKLEEHFNKISSIDMRALFNNDKHRAEKMSLKHGGIFLDYSKNLIENETLPLLCDLAREVGLENWRDKMFTGEKINNTENRAVLHTALRNQSNDPIYVDGKDVMPDVNLVLEKMEVFSEKVRNGSWKGYTNKAITNIVNIGIGGSDLGPIMISNALEPYKHERLKVSFISNIDGAHSDSILAKLDPETTLFIIASKSFTTQETISNAHIARDWFLAGGASKSDISKHFVAVSTNQKAVAAFGIDTQNMFEFWDWVGGRYSLWSAIGLSVVLGVGMKTFKELLSGAHAMDNHFKQAPLEKNMPVIMALLGVWYNNFFDAESHGIFPYDDYLRNLPFYLQQADMESNGKSVDKNGIRVDYATAPIIWGTTGINGQHAYYQAIHQGTHLIPADFIVSAITYSDHKEQHDILISNALAQTEALMKGRTLEETYAGFDKNDTNLELKKEHSVKHMVFTGNNPTNTLMLTKLTPETLGMLIALYEHKIFVQGMIWNVNSYDQWGVELGKKLAKTIFSEISQDDPVSSHDSSTNALINHYKDIVNKNSS